MFEQTEEREALYRMTSIAVLPMPLDCHAELETRPCVRISMPCLALVQVISNRWHSVTSSLPTFALVNSIFLGGICQDGCLSVKSTEILSGYKQAATLAGSETARSVTAGCFSSIFLFFIFLTATDFLEVKVRQFPKNNRTLSLWFPRELSQRQSALRSLSSKELRSPHPPQPRSPGI